jgi:hypothetical protein
MWKKMIGFGSQMKKRKKKMKKMINGGNVK